MKKILHLLRSHSGRFRQYFPAILGSVFCSFIAGLLMLGVPVLLGRLASHFPRVPKVELSLLILVLVLRALVSYTSYRMIAGIAAVLVFRARRYMFKKIVYAPIAFHRNTSSAGLVSTITNDAALVEQLLLNLIPALTQHGAIVLSVSAYLLLFHIQLFGILAITLAPILLFLLIAGKNMRAVTYRAQRNLSEMASIVQESLQGLNLIKRLAKEHYFSRKFNERNEELLRLKERRINWQSLLEAVLPVIMVSIGAWLVWLLKSEYSSGRLGVAGLTSFAAGLAIIGTSAGRLLHAYITLEQIAGAVDRMREAMPVEMWVPATDDKREAAYRRTSRSPLEIEHLSFTYPGGSPGVVDITLRIHQGEVVRLTGPNGAGKSTLVDCILGLQPANSGSISLGGTECRDMDIQHWREHFGVLTREPYLFDTCIFQNIALGCGNAGHDDVVRASRMSGLHEYVRGLPFAYNTRVGEGGVLLSSGQRQLVALTRIFLQNPSVVILDEATVSLDQDIRPKVLQALRDWQQGKIVIVITHESDHGWPYSRTITMNTGRVTSDTGNAQEAFN